MAKFTKGKGYSKADLLNDGIPIILYGRLYTDYETLISEVNTYAKLKNNSVISKGYEVIIPSSGESSDEIARASVIKMKDIIIGGDLNVLTLADTLEPIFLAQALSNGRQKKELERKAEGKSIVHLYNKDIKKVSIIYPTIEEQKQISRLILLFENLIKLHQRKLEQLESLRKAYLQRMFPIQNKLEPELRFCNFYDDWELCELGSIGYTYNGLTGKNKDDFGHGDAKYIPYMNVFSNPIADPAMLESIGIDKKQNHVQYGDVLFTTSSETPEDVGMSSVWMHNLNNIYLNSFCFGFHPTIEIDPYYLAYMLRSNEIRKQFRILAQGISRYNIAKIKVMKIRVPIPNIEEQKLIGNLFKELDNNISFCEQKLEMIRQLKEAYLQKMFV